jgi:hypothetical protein
MAKYAIYDLEIIRAIPPKNEADRIAGIEYCSGWTDYVGMGISVGAYCVLDSATGEIRLPAFCTQTPALLAAQLSDLSTLGALIGGFNTPGFDDRLMAAHGCPIQSDFDILEMVRSSALREPGASLRGRSYSMAKIAEANGYAKTMSGENAPIEWQRGNRQQVIDYCINDVLIEAETLKRLLLGTLVDPNTGKLLKWEE